jgi:hypothetical protein
MEKMDSRRGEETRFNGVFYRQAMQTRPSQRSLLSSMAFAKNVPSSATGNGARITPMVNGKQI